jgi:hypothetical protein
MKLRIEQLTLGGDPARWAEAGFTIAGDAMLVGEVPLAFVSGTGLLGWLLNELDAEVDGLPIASPAAGGPAERSHPNGAVRIDHLVVLTPDLKRTTAALEAIGVERRRLREVETDGSPLRQGFFRLGEVILEVVEHARVDPGPARFWGITFAVADLDAAAELLGEKLGSVRDAVQPGRRIATVRREVGLGLPVALISEETV